MACNHSFVAELCQIKFPNSSDQMEDCYLRQCFWRKTSVPFDQLVPITVLYGVIFVLGVVGNVSTCIVIRTHHLLQKISTNRYLFNLAIADLVTLLVGMPFEIYLLWNQYPWQLPDIFCQLKAWISETTSYVSVLTILSFSAERYVAICHSFSLAKLATIHRKLSLILALIWVAAICSAFPYALLHWSDYFIKEWPGSKDHGPIKRSKMCMFAMAFDPASYESTFRFLFHCSAVAYFVIPLCVIAFLYVRIGFKVSRSRHTLVQLNQGSNMVSTDFHSKKVLGMLVAVIVAFFLCYFPYQLQRLLFFWVTDASLLTLINHYHTCS